MNQPRRYQRSTTVAAFALLLPSFIPLVVFTLYPLAISGYLSFRSWNLLSETKPFVGFANYVQLVRDPTLGRVFANTALYTVAVVLGGIGLGLILALLLNQRLIARPLWRGVFFLPTVVPMAAISALWLWIYDPGFGLMNYLLRVVGLPTSQWLQSPSSALWAIVLMMLWQSAGYNMVILLAGLQTISTDVYEAARLDGAGGQTIFWRITLPLLSPTVLFLVVVSSIQAFRVFEPVWVMSLGTGGPANSTATLVFYLYRQAFMFFQAGYASAIAFLIVGIALVFTVLQLWVSKRWVVYE